MNPCDDIVAFADGELDAGRGNALREHLRSCATCRRNLVEALQLGARLSELVTEDAHTEPTAESLAEMPEIDDERFRRRPGRGHFAKKPEDT